VTPGARYCHQDGWMVPRRRERVDYGYVFVSSRFSLKEICKFSLPEGSRHLWPWPLRRVKSNKPATGGWRERVASVGEIYTIVCGVGTFFLSDNLNYFATALGPTNADMSVASTNDEEYEPLLTSRPSLRAPHSPPTPFWKRASPLWWVNYFLYFQSLQVRVAFL
jgi:hypothetical protein